MLGKLVVVLVKKNTVSVRGGGLGHPPVRSMFPCTKYKLNSVVRLKWVLVGQILDLIILEKYYHQFQIDGFEGVLGT